MTSTLLPAPLLWLPSSSMLLPVMTRIPRSFSSYCTASLAIRRSSFHFAIHVIHVIL